MSLSTLSAVIRLAEEAHTEAVNHWVVGGVTLVILVAAILALLAFGAGREHS